MFGQPNITGAFAIAGAGEVLSAGGAFLPAEYVRVGDGAIGTGQYFYLNGIGTIYHGFSAQSSNRVYTDNGRVKPATLNFNYVVKC